MQYTIRKNISTLSEEKASDRIENSGTITQCVMHFPPGCNALVEVRMLHNGKAICPVDGYIALDETTPVFGLLEPCREGDTITAEFINHDESYEHTISVIVSIESEKHIEIGHPPIEVRT